MITLFWFFAFDFEDNPVSFLKQENANSKHSVLLQVKHDIYSQMLLISQLEGLQIPNYYELLSSIHLSLKEDNVVDFSLV